MEQNRSAFIPTPATFVSIIVTPKVIKGRRRVFVLLIRNFSAKQARFFVKPIHTRSGAGLTALDLYGARWHRGAASGMGAHREEICIDLRRKLRNWYPNKRVLAGLISTNDFRIESFFELGAETGRDVLVFGAFLENSARDMNVNGVNPKLYELQKQRNIQYAMDVHFAKFLEKEKQHLQVRLERAAPSERGDLLWELSSVEARIKAHEALRVLKNVYTRFAHRAEYEQEIRQTYGENVPTHLGAMTVNRDSEASWLILENEPGRQLFLVTGTQGGRIEIDSQLYKLSGRPLDFRCRSQSAADGATDRPARSRHHQQPDRHSGTG